jgi:hypothetical protein
LSTLSLYKGIERVTVREQSEVSNVDGRLVARSSRMKLAQNIFDIGQSMLGLEGLSYGCKHLKKFALTIAAMAIGQMAGSVSVGGEP